MKSANKRARSSFAARHATTEGSKELPAWLHVGPLRYEGNWLRWLNRPQTDAEEAALRKCIARGSPYGGPLWQRLTAKRLGLESSLRPRGRPRTRPAFLPPEK